MANRTLGCLAAAAVLLAPTVPAAPAAALPADSIDVVGVDNVSEPEGCVVGDVDVEPTDDGTNYTGFVITNPSVTDGCAVYKREIYVRVIYDDDGDTVPDGSYYMVIPAQEYSAVTLGVFGGKPAIYLDNGYTTKATTPPPMATTTFLHEYDMVNSKRDEIVP